MERGPTKTSGEDVCRVCLAPRAKKGEPMTPLEQTLLDRLRAARLPSPPFDPPTHAQVQARAIEAVRKALGGLPDDLEVTTVETEPGVVEIDVSWPSREDQESAPTADR